MFFFRGSCEFWLVLGGSELIPPGLFFLKQLLGVDKV